MSLARVRPLESIGLRGFPILDIRFIQNSTVLVNVATRISPVVHVVKFAPFVIARLARLASSAAARRTFIGNIDSSQADPAKRRRAVCSGHVLAINNGYLHLPISTRLVLGSIVPPSNLDCKPICEIKVVASHISAC